MSKLKKKSVTELHMREQALAFYNTKYDLSNPFPNDGVVCVLAYFIFFDQKQNSFIRN